MAHQEDKVLDKKTKENLKKEILSEINTDVKKEIVETFVEDVKKEIDNDYKEEIKRQISDEVIEDVKANIKREQGKLNRRKTFKIIRLNIYLIVLLAFSLFLIYRLYKTDNLAILKKNTTTTTTSTTTAVIKDLNWYINNYGYLINNLHFTNFELLKGNYNIKEIPVSDKLAMVYKTLGTNVISVEGTIYTINEEDIINAYKELFGSVDDYVGTDFTVDSLNFAYSVSSKKYISVAKRSEKVEYVVNKIIDIKENNDILTIDAYVGVVKEDKLYCLLDLENEIADYRSGSDLTVYRDSLTQIQYKFKKIDGKYYIDAISRK
ncbi:MAG: hypothetical protein K2G03_00705 [Bacilli bacterium]|nr:hypothetical protein [Bacilli bacterium]